MSLASYANYPGGQALAILHDREAVPTKLGPLSVHIDTFAAMTGISRFCENGAPWSYSKQEMDTFSYSTHNFTFLIDETPIIPDYGCLMGVEGYRKTKLERSLYPLHLIMKPIVFIHGRLDSDLVTGPWPGCE
eukprot:TRINITY_DN12034_c0_g2_i2.p1 TRINITY_DN12034_c0_g2~~TRINITY_DN12034_c0_g2_i2.p1  ORF type:complete len:133 (+),score=14.18 TRINITY_DN12034_c0_g2_i2:185-583(+)